MLTLDLIETEGLDFEETDVARRSAAASARLIEAGRIWVAHSYAAYAKSVQAVDPVKVVVPIKDDSGKVFETADVFLTMTPNLFQEIALAALCYGGAALVSVLGAALGSRVYPPTARLILSAHEAVERWLAVELAMLEHSASSIARTQSDAMRRANRAFRARFERRTFGHATTHLLSLPGVGGKAALYERLAKVRDHRAAIVPLEREMAARDRKDGPTPTARQKARKRDAYRQLYYDLFADRHRAHATALMTLEAEIFDLFPPALAILGTVEKDLDLWLAADADARAHNLDIIAIEKRYDLLIWNALVAHDGMLDTIDRSLANRSVPIWSDRYFSLSFAQRHEAGGLFAHVIGNLMAEAPDAWDRLANLVTRGAIFGTLASQQEEEAARQENHVLGRLPLLAAMVEDGRAAAEISATTLILGAFLRDLGRAQVRAIEDDRASRSRWHKAELALALGGMVVGLVSLPFGAGEAILPASLGTLASLVVGGLMLGSLVLLVRAVMAELSSALTAPTQIRDKLIDLGQTDPEALEALATFLTRRKDMASGLAAAALQELVELAAQRLLPPLALALDLRDHFDAMDALTEGLSDLQEVE